MVKSKKFFSGLALLGLVGTSTMLAGCGSDNAVKDDSSSKGSSEATQEEKSDLSGSLAGAGASSQEAAMNAWMAQYMQKNPDVTVTYDAVGSGAGITQFTDGQVLWAGSDAALEGDEVKKAKDRCGADAMNLPVYVSPVAVIFKLPEIKELNIDPTTLAKIFSGEITQWDDPAIKEANPDVDLPKTKITPVHRADKSGTTENFTDYLHKAAPDAWPHDPSKSWPMEGGESGDKTAGVVQAVTQGEGTIGYADASQAGDLGTVALKAGDSFVKFSNEAAAKALDSAEPADTGVEGDHALEISRTPKDSGAYPLILVSYSVVCSQYPQKEADLVKSFINFQISKEGQEAAAKSAGSAPISDTLRSELEKSLEAIKAK
ncbi:phosphate ABC transporter substrate-binding protein PstS [Gleimia hominis]|uniref:Phosphate-binding protein n=1 Tax=Gleimia hominis TaxID=595468 RepID=A0ABU3I7V7_9ACTO|nr:phosphate ABC transporter substrate-binding protein PstS [Gleimia hominis]MDT3766474.1 phosphate ABC transporter substrate-binding protein PstS [Gleimia hominis]